MDWNLIPTLEALLNERSVSRAARRLGLSQPAVSNALARLRRQFNDELLVRQGSTYVLTPFAEQLSRLTREAVKAASAVTIASVDFDPGSSTRKFLITASDYAQVSVGPYLTSAIREHAPAVTVGFVSPFGGNFERNEEILDATDGWIAPREMLPGQNFIGSVADRWVCIADRHHPRIGDVLTLRDAADCSWVAPAIGGEALRLHLDGLAAHGVVPRIDVSTDSFCTIPFLVSGTDRVGLVQESIAIRLGDAAGIRVLECPWAVQAQNLTFWWSAKKVTDSGHAWLRDVVEQALARISLRPGDNDVSHPPAQQT